MIREQYKISIPGPCNQSWEDMQPHENGRFCGHCPHAVIDFSTMTDAEVLNILKHHKGGRICGNVGASQLDRPIQEISAKRRSFWPAAMLTSLFGMASPVMKAVAAKPATFITNDQDTVIRPALPSGDSDLFKLTGTIVDQAGEALIYASIKMDTLNLGTYTDTLGNFELNLPAEWVDKCPVITVSYVGFVSKQVFAECNSENELLPIRLTLEPFITGEIKVSRVEMLKYKIRRFFRRRR